MAIKIGVDGRPLVRPMTGIRRYTQEMCRALSRITDVELYLYGPSPISIEILSEIEATVRVAQATSGIPRQIWAETYLPYWAKKDNIDVYWGPCHRLPYLLPGHIASVVTIHDLAWKYAGNTMRHVTRWLDRIHMPSAARRAHKVIAVSEATAGAIQKEFGLDRNDIDVISPAPTALSSCDLAQNSNILNKHHITKPYVLFVGTLEPRKNLDRLLEAYAGLPVSLREKTPFVIAGDHGWGKVDLHARIERHNLNDHVYLIGAVNDNDLATLYAEAYILAMPSLYEGFGMPLVEAMAHGTPVLTSNTSSMPEVAQDAGILVDPLDIASIRKGLMQFLDTPDYRDKLAELGKSNASRYHWDKSAQKLRETLLAARRMLDHRLCLQPHDIES